MVFAPARKRRRAELLFASHRESWWLNRSPVEVLGPHDRVVVIRGRERIDVAVAFEVDPTYRTRVGRRGVDLVGAPAPAASEESEDICGEGLLFFVEATSQSDELRIPAEFLPS